MLMGLSPNVLPGPKEGDLAGHDMGHESKRMHIEKGNIWLCGIVFSCSTCWLDFNHRMRYTSVSQKMAYKHFKNLQY